MKTRLNTLILAAAFSLVSVNLFSQNTEKTTRRKENAKAINTRKESPVKIIEYIVGTWEVDKVYKGKKDITNSDSVGTNRIIEFDREGKYVITSGSEKTERGLYRLNENHSLLYLENEERKEPTEWKVSFSGNGAMTLQPTGTYPHAESFKYVYTRTSAASNVSNRPN